MKCKTVQKPSNWLSNSFFLYIMILGDINGLQDNKLQ
jgi:hypothetical protein